MSSQTPQYEPPHPMTAAQKALIEKENHFRHLFAEDSSNPELRDAHLLLEDVFANEDSFQYQDEDEEEKKVPKLLTQNRKLGLTGKAIVSQNEWTTRWTEFTNGILSGLDWNNVFCAGGAVLANIIADNTGYSSSDIDLFLYGLDTDEAANAKLREIHQLIVKNTGSRGDVIRTARAVTILNTHPYRHVQVILRAYKSPAEVLLGFDIDSCTVGFDGQKVYCMERFKRALTKRYNLVNVSRRSLTYEQRLYKYSKRGFAVAVPNLDKSRVDQSIFSKSIKDTYGLSKLLLYDYLTQKSIVHIRAGNIKAAEWNVRYQESSDYNGDLDIPWGPNVSANSVMSILKLKDKRQFFAQIHKMKKAAAESKSTFGQTQKKPEHLFERIFLDTTDEQGNKQAKIEWIRNNPAYQDLDGGFTRPLMTGSFNLPPPVQAIWDDGTYASTPTNPEGLSRDAGFVPGENYQFGPKSFGKASSPSPAKKIPISSFASTTTSTSSPQYFGGSTGGYEFDIKFTDTSSSIGHSAPGGAVFTQPSTNSFGFGTAPRAFTFGDGSPTPATGSMATGGFTSTIASSSTGHSFSGPSPSKTSFNPVPFKPKKKETPPPTKKDAPAAFAKPLRHDDSFGTAPPRDDLLGAIQVVLDAHYEKLKNLITANKSTSLQQPSGQEEAPPTTKLLLLIALCNKQGSITSEERGILKDLVIDRNEAVYSALEVFELDQDLEEFVDTLKKVVKSKLNN